MKAVLISIRPKWVEKIVNGEKTIEVRKTAPKTQTPFKCYIYETQAIGLSNRYSEGYKIALIGKGKIVGEFVCDKIDEYTLAYGFSEKENKDGRYGKIKDYCYFQHNLFLDKMCLTEQQFNDFGKGETLYGWHISDLKVYDKPRDITEFKRWNRIEVNAPCAHTKWLYPPCNECNSCNLTRPPQSWQYIEEN